MKSLNLLSANNINRSNKIIKKYLLSIIWCILHATILSIITIKIKGTPLEFSLFMVVLIYLSFYLVMTSILLDKIIKAEINSIGK